MDLTGYTTEEVKKVASKLSKKFGTFTITGADLIFKDHNNLTREDIEPLILDIIKNDAIDQVDSIAESARNSVLTPGDGQKIAYAYKYEEAKEIMSKPQDAALNPADYIMLSAELQLHTPEPLTLRQIAQLIMDKVLESKKAFAWIEARRYTLHNNIRAASTKESIYSIVKNSKFDIPSNL